MKAKKVLLGVGLCALATLAIASSVFAVSDTSPCPKEEGLKWYKADKDNGYVVNADGTEDKTFKPPTKYNDSYKKEPLKDPDYFPVKCADVTLNQDGKDTRYKVYGKTAKDCTKASAIASAKKCAEDNDLHANTALIINAIIGIIGIIAVVMIVVGGITYSTSQGDPAKTKKGKDTILYGVIGVIVSLLAFAIVNFVLDALING